MGNVEQAAVAVVKELRAMFAENEPRTEWYGTISAAEPNVMVLVDGAEAPTPASSAVTVHYHDRVMVKWVNNRLVVTANLTVPAVVTDDEYQDVKDITEEADKLLDQIAAVSEETGKQLAQIYHDVARSGEGVAEISNYVGIAEDYTETLSEAVDRAKSDLSDIAADLEAADEAIADINEDYIGVVNALGMAQDVLDVLEEHAGDMDDYINAHLALLPDGLHVVPLSNGYFVVLGPDGLHVYSPQMVEVAKYGDGFTVGALNRMHMEASGDRLSFKDPSGNEVAYIAVDQNGESTFYMTRAVVVSDLRFADWKMYGRANGNMALKWVGGM